MRSLFFYTHYIKNLFSTYHRFFTVNWEKFSLSISASRMVRRTKTPPPLDGGENCEMTTIHIHVELPDGTRHTLEAPEGYRVMEVIRDYGLPINAECGGACACATCHVRLPPEWAGRVVAPLDEELDKLDEILGADEFSRLSCQLLTDAAIDGLVVRLAKDSLAPAQLRLAG
jgi:2Fe-2S ferredoxin